MRMAAVFFCLLPVSAWAQDDLKQAEILFDDLKYEQALKAVEKTLKSSRRGPRDLTTAYKIKGLSLSALGREKEALQTFRMLLAIDPGYELKGVKSPKLTAPFFQAAGMTQKHGGIVLVHEPPEPGPKLAGLVLQATLKSDPMDMVKKVRMRFWSKAEKPLQMSMEVKAPQEVKMRLPLDFDHPAVNYYFEATNAHNGVLVRVGSWYKPLRLKAKPETVSKITVEPVDQAKLVVKTTPVTDPAPPKEDGDDSTAWYKSWWFWTAVGVVVVGAATGTTLALVGQDSNGSVDCFVDFGVR